MWVMKQTDSLAAPPRLRAEFVLFHANPMKGMELEELASFGKVISAAYDLYIDLRRDDLAVSLSL